MARVLNNSQSRLVALVVNTVANPAEAEGLDELMAIGAHDAAQASGIAMPRDLALVGHDGVRLASWASHSITTIAPPPGSVSAALAQIIAQPAEAPPRQCRIACTVRWGRSTGEKAP